MCIRLWYIKDYKISQYTFKMTSTKTCKHCLTKINLIKYMKDIYYKKINIKCW